MVKLIIFFRKPADVDAFEEHFANTHVPLINVMPNLRRAAVTRALGAPRGEPPYYLIHEVYFEDMPALTYALNSPEGRAAGADLMVFAREIVSLMFAEVWGEDPFELGLMGMEPAPEEAEAVQAIVEDTSATVPAAKPSLVPINTSFLEKGPEKETASAETPAEVAEASIETVETTAPDVEPAAIETPAAEAETPVITESTMIESALPEAPASEAETPAQLPIAESTVLDANADDVTTSDTPAPEHPRPQ